MTSAVPWRSGRFDVAVNVTVAHPLESVVVSGELFDQLYGRPIAYTSAPCTEKPRVSETWKRPVSVRRLPSGCGENLTLSTTSRSGREIVVTETAAPPARAGAIAELGPEGAVELPRRFDALTATRSVCVTSADVVL